MVFDFVGRTKLLKLSKDSRYFYSGLLVKYVYSRLLMPIEQIRLILRRKSNTSDQGGLVGTDSPS